MKKLLTLAIGLFASLASLNAQVSCDFTYSGDTISGVYEFVAPSSFPPFLYSFEWQFGTGNTAYGPQATNTYQQSMIDSVMLTVYGADSNIACISVLAVSVYVGGTNTNCPILYSSSPANPNMFTFTSPGANTPPTWSFPNGTTITGMQADYTFPESGVYTVCMYIASGGTICNSCVNVTVSGDTIINPDPSCDANFWASTSSLVGYFVPTYYAMLNSSAYAWTFGDGTTSTEQYPYHVYDAPGYYDVCLTYSSGPCSDYMCQSVYIPEYTTPPIDSSCYAGYVITQNSPYEVTIVNAASGNNLQFIWTLSGMGISISTSGAYPTIQVQSTGDFLFCLDVISADSCFSSFCDSISIGDNGILGGRISAAGYTINVVSPQTITGFITGIDKAEEAKLEVYPNPFNDFITIKNVVNQSIFNVFSVDGRKVVTGSIVGNNQVISTSTLGAGIYVLQLITSEGQIATQKIIKK